MNAVIAHPAALAAPPRPAGVLPRYLVRHDGVVLDYNPVLGQRPGFTPADALPPAQLERIEAARMREVAAAASRAAAAEQAAAEQRRREAARQVQPVGQQPAAARAKGRVAPKRAAARPEAL